MGVVIAGRTQIAAQTPFGPEVGWVSTNVEDAILEARTLAVANDRFVLLASYGGNAGTGRYLEFFPSLDSSLAGAPVSVATSAKCLFLILTTVAASAACTIGFYDVTTNTLLHLVTFSGVKQVVQTGTVGAPIFTLPATGALGIKIDSGSINKPYVILALSASI